jgi:HlyD family secretion protein
MKSIKIYVSVLGLLLLGACKGNKESFDASGTFEADETIVSAEANGVLRFFKIEEGFTVKEGEQVGLIDTVQLYLKKKQLETQIQAVLSQKPDIQTQVAALQTQLHTAERESLRVANLVKADAATTKQLDDMRSQVELIKKQIDAQQSVLGINTRSITEQTEPLYVQIEQLNDQLAKCRVLNPVSGVVLTRYTNAAEMVNAGKPLYKLANVSKMILRAYISGDQLAGLKLNQQVKVLTDGADGKYKEYSGTVQWISDKAEFTPKTIQTKNERANLVYAVKILVKNDGYLKIGMYGEVNF